MFKKINIILVLFVLLIVSLGAVSAADDVNETLSIDGTSQNSEVLTASQYTVTSDTYSQYFSNSGEMGSAINSGDTVVLNGDFSKKDFTINKQIILKGSGGTISNGIIKLTSGASGTEISGLTIRNTENYHSGIFIDGAKNCHIHDNDIKNTGMSSYPIVLNENSDFNRIVKNTLEAYGQTYGHGSRSTSIILLGSADNNYIAENNIRVADANAIYLSSYGGGTFKGGESFNNVIYKNVITYTVNTTSWAYAIQLMGGNNTVDSNIVYGAYRGVSSSNQPLNKVINNIIYVAGTDFSSHAATGGDYGIALAANATVRNNTVQGNFVGAAISAGDNSVIEDNYVNATKGYGIEASGDDTKIIGNEIYTTSGAAVHQQGNQEGIVVDRNVIVSDTGIGVLLSKSSKTKYPSRITVTNNQITTSNKYMINAADADKDSWVINNNTGTGTVLTPAGEVDPSVPDFNFNGTTHIITPANYHNFIDENGNLKNDFVQDGDTLYFDGVFDNKQILVTSSVKITGNSPKFTNSTFIVTTDSVWIENLTIINKNAERHNAWGIFVADAQIVKIVNNNITVYDPASAYAVYIYQSSKVYVEDNELFSGGNSLTYPLLGYGAEECEFTNNVVNCLGTGEIHVFEDGADINANTSEVCIGQCLGDVLKEHCLDGTNIVPEIYRTYGILMIKSSNNTLTGNDVKVRSLINQTLPSNSTNSLVGIDFYYDCDNNMISNNKIDVEGMDNYLYGAGAIAHSTGQFSSTTAKNNTFVDNEITVKGPNVAEGLIFGDGCDDTKILNNDLILECDRMVYGINLEISDKSTIKGNNIKISSDVAYGIEAFESDGNVIENNTIVGEGKVTSGIAGVKTNNNIIQNNTITSKGSGDKLDFAVRDSVNAPNSGVFLTGVSKGNLIDSNIIETENGYPVDLDAAAAGNTVTYNYLKGKEGSGDDGVNNSASNTVHDNYASTFDNLKMDNVTVEYNTKFTVTVETEKEANGANVQFMLGNLILGNATVSNQKASLTYDLNKNLNVGKYDVTAVLTKSGFKSGEITSVLEITKANITVTVDDVSVKQGDSVPIVAHVVDSNKNPVSGIVVRFQRNTNYIGTATSDENGLASFNTKIPALSDGTYNLIATTTESDNYAQSIGQGKLTVSDTSKTYTKITAGNVTMYCKDGTRLAATITDLDGKALSGLNVIVTINNVSYAKTSDENGQFSIALGLPSGVYNASFDFKGDAKYRASSATSTVTINPTLSGTDVVMMYKNGTRYYVSVKKDNKPVADVKIKLNINGVMYYRTTSAVGTASIAINLIPNTYIVTAEREDTGEKVSNTLLIKPLLVENKDLTIYYRNGTGYTVKVIKQDGSVAGAGEVVKFNINGVFYERKTNDQGIARLNLNLGPSDYIITAEYNDFKVSNKIKILPVLSASDLTKKYGTSTPFTVKIVDGQGKPLANATIGFNINGVFYNRISDSTGTAKLNINLIAGEYIITSSYNGANIANKVTITA